MTDSRLEIGAAAIIGPDCEIATSALIGEGVTIGRGVCIGPRAVVLGPCTIGDACKIGPAAVLQADDPSGASLVLEADVHIMAGATVAAAITIAGGARVQPGAVVQRPIPPHAVVAGNPAEIVGYALSHGSGPAEHREAAESRIVGITASRVRGVTLHHLPRILDIRGNLTVGEFGRSIPFKAKRYFMVFGVPSAEIRGEHAHRTCKQFLLCVSGSCSLVVDDGTTREEFVLNDPATGLYLPALTWGVQYKYSLDAVLLVFASEYYDGAEYIRDYAEFLSLTESLATGVDA